MVKVARDAEARAERLGPALRDHALRWVDAHAGLGHDTVGERTRREYRRLLTTFAFRYFPPDARLVELDRKSLQGFVIWLAAYRGEPSKPKRRAPGKRKTAKRAPRGQRREQLLAAIKASPGARPSELAKTMKVKPTQVHALIAKARTEKLIVKSGKGYALKA